VDDEGHVVEVNDGAAALIGDTATWMMGRRIGEVLHCTNLTPDHPECGKTPLCGECSLRRAITESLGPDAMDSRTASIWKKHPEGHEHLMLIVEAAALFYGNSVGSCAGCGRLSGVTPCHCTTGPGGERHTQPGSHWCITWGDTVSA
jgi:hypothetical protein